MVMKKFFFSAILLFLTASSFACDICGCSSGNYFIGPFPWFHKHFIGVRYSFRSFNTVLKNDASQYSKDFYQTAEIWGGWNFGKKWQLLAFLPYNINRQTSDDGINKTTAFGDVTFIANYNLLNTTEKNKQGNRVSQQLMIGGGLKLPTGKFSADPDDFLPSVNNQAGTGTVDLLLTSMYSIRINSWSLNSNINYKFNQSAQHFQFGNRFNAAAYLSHTIATRKTTLYPNAGLQYELLSVNKFEKIKVADTGGNALLASAGLETNFNKIAVGINTQIPVHQNLSNGQTSIVIRGMLHVTYTF